LIIMESADFFELRHYLRIENEKREMRLAACAGKQRFDTPAMANHAMRAIRNKDGKHGVFKCEFCGGWHVGSGIVPKVSRRLKVGY